MKGIPNRLSVLILTFAFSIACAAGASPLATATALPPATAATPAHTPHATTAGAGEHATQQATLAHPESATPAIVAPPEATTAGAVTIRVDGAARFQTMSGFGASFRPFDGPLSRLDDPNGPERTTSTPEQRAAIAQILYGDLGLTRTRVFPNAFEPANDNDDPFTFNPAGYDWTEVNQITDFVALARPLGLQTPWATFSMELGHQQAWLRQPGTCALNPALIDEEVEWLLAAAVHFRDAGQELPYMAVNNEPDLCPPGYKIEIGDMVTIVKALGARLRAEGLATRIVATDGWIPQNVYHYAEAILADPDARQYVGALAYHAYADGYDDPATLLANSAQGRPPPAAVEARERLRDLAAQYNLPVWMTEVCYCTPRSEEFSEFDLLRARLNHLHDELTIANASAFDAINLYNIRRPGVSDELVEVFYRSDGTMERFQTATYGHLLAHYARFVVPGSVRLQAESSDPRVRVLAFERPDGRLVLVALNNNSFALDANIAWTGLGRSPSSLATVVSREDAIWQSGPDVSVGEGTARVLLPALSVTTTLGQ